MSRTLVLMRHGKSGYPAGISDHQRPLADRGNTEAAIAGEWMQRDGLIPDVVLCSTATRTRETLHRTGFDTGVVRYIDSLYGGTPEDVCEAIRMYVPNDAATVLVVGHEPGMPATALTLAPDADIDAFPTSAYGVVQVASEWDQIGYSADQPATFISLNIPR